MRGCGGRVSPPALRACEEIPSRRHVGRCASPRVVAPPSDSSELSGFITSERSALTIGTAAAERPRRRAVLGAPSWSSSGLRRAVSAQERRRTKTHSQTPDPCAASGFWLLVRTVRAAAVMVGQVRAAGRVLVVRCAPAETRAVAVAPPWLLRGAAGQECREGGDAVACSGGRFVSGAAFACVAAGPRPSPGARGWVARAHGPRDAVDRGWSSESPRKGGARPRRARSLARPERTDPPASPHRGDAAGARAIQPRAQGAQAARPRRC